MLNTARQNKLDLVVDKLKQINGVVDVQSDDFNSYSINIFVTLDADNSYVGSISGKKPFRFLKSIRVIKTMIRKALDNISFSFLDIPEMTYYYDIGRRVKDGYNIDYIKLNIEI
jgi:hypothetical protein